MNYGLPDAAIRKIRAVLARYPQVERAILYGSRAKGSYKNGSDIDLTLCGGTALTRIELRKMGDEFDDLLLPYTIDLSLFAEIRDPDLIGHIQRAGVVFYSRDGARPQRVVPMIAL